MKRLTWSERSPCSSGTSGYDWLDEISKQLRLPGNAIEWAAKFLCDKGMAERGFEENEIRLSRGNARFEDAVRALSSSTKSSK